MEPVRLSFGSGREPHGPDGPHRLEHAAQEGLTMAARGVFEARQGLPAQQGASSLAGVGSKCGV